MIKLTISMPMLNTPLNDLPDMARAAEDAGFHGVWSYEFWRNPYIGLAGPALQTQHIALGTAIGAAFTRTPWDTANQAADIDELSNGRLILGLGAGAPEFLEWFHGLPFPEKPGSRFKEYVRAVRSCWRYLQTGDTSGFTGDFFKMNPPPLNPWGRRTLARPHIPIYMGAMRPLMMQHAAEVADGVVGTLFTPRYIREVVLPNLAIGAARVGRDVKDIDIASYLICAVSKDRNEAMRRARIHVGMYTAGTPIGDAIVKWHGLEEDMLPVRYALMTEGPSALERVTSDRLVETFSIAGTPDECRRQLEPYREALANRTIILHTPYVPPLEREESADAFHCIVDAFGT